MDISVAMLLLGDMVQVYQGLLSSGWCELKWLSLAAHVYVFGWILEVVCD